MLPHVPERKNVTELSRLEDVLMADLKENKQQRQR